VLLDVLDDVFLLNLPLEAAERTFDRLTLLNLDFSHAWNSLPDWSCGPFEGPMKSGEYARLSPGQARILGPNQAKGQ
jgi:hypothetical protein